MSIRHRGAAHPVRRHRRPLAVACDATIETLERRQLFSAALLSGVWQIRGDESANVDDVITIEAVPGDAGSLQAVINGNVGGIVLASEVTAIDVDAGAGADRVTLRLDSAVVTATVIIAGGDGDDRLVGSSLDETFHGGPGDDRIDAGAGNDTLSGNAGNDVLFGADGDDQLFGGDGKDILAGGYGDDHLDGGIGKDRLGGGHDADALLGDRGGDTLSGGKGVDTMDGGKGRDRVYVESGVDIVGPVGSTPSPKKIGADRLSVDDTHESTLRQTTDAELKQWLIDAAVKQWSWAFGKPANPWIYYWGRGGEVAIRAGDSFNGGPEVVGPPVGAPTPNAPSPPTGGEAAGDHSSTNTQVAGVDEADLVETDGVYIYSLQNDELIIADATPVGDMSVVARKDFEGTPLGIYLSGDRLTMLTGSMYYWPTPLPGDPVLPASSIMPPQPPQDPFVTVIVFDVSNPASPAVVETTKLDGSYNESRLIGDQLYVVMRNDNWVPEPKKIPNPSPPPAERPPGDGSPIDDPVVVPEPGVPADPGNTGGSTGNTGAGKVAAPDIWPGDGYSDTIYESEASYRARLEAMPLAEFLPGYQSTASGKQTTGPLVSAPNAYVRDLGEEEIGQNLTTVALLDIGDTAGGPTATSTVAGYGGTVYASDDSLYLASTTWAGDDGDSTRLFKFGLDADNVSLLATGSVAGSVLNQFGMDEFADTFRIATNNWSGDGPSNHLFVLEQVGDELQTIGSVRNIAKGEDLQSARFDGDRAYVVTFLRIDPLFTVDLSNPRSPKIAGELKIPGYSSYLQPIGNGLLLGIGRDIDADGRGDNGLQVSLFDVANLASPARLANHTIADAYSEAEYDHHAFSYFSEQKILTVPVGHYDGREYSQSLAVLEVDPAGKAFKSLGDVNPPSEVRRSLRIGEVLFAVASEHIQAVELLNPNVVIKTLKTSA